MRIENIISRILRNKKKEKMMLIELENVLSKIDKSFVEIDEHQVQKMLEKIPLDIFGKILIDRPAEYPNLISWLPEMPSPDIQKSWTGSADHVLMKQSTEFIKTVLSTYHEIASRPLRDGKILDFGCGWGRLIRLLYKYVPAQHIYGVDPWDTSIKICEETKIRANLYISEYVPRSLPVPEGTRFDFIMAFSVFTHLSEKVTKICAATLRDYLSDSGILAITIRPVEYWGFACSSLGQFTKEQSEELIAAHNQNGFAFAPHNREKIEGEVTYGDSSVSLDFIERNFEGLDIIKTDFNEVDPYQLIVFLKPSDPS